MLSCSLRPQIGQVPAPTDAPSRAVSMFVAAWVPSRSAGAPSSEPGDGGISTSRASEGVRVSPVTRTAEVLVPWILRHGSDRCDDGTRVLARARVECRLRSHEVIRNTSASESGRAWTTDRAAGPFLLGALLVEREELHEDIRLLIEAVGPEHGRVEPIVGIS